MKWVQKLFCQKKNTMLITIKTKIFSFLLCVKRKNIFICQHCLKIVLGSIIKQIQIRRIKQTISIIKKGDAFDHLPCSIRVCGDSHNFFFSRPNKILEISTHNIGRPNFSFIVTFEHEDTHHIRVTENQMKITENEKTFCGGYVTQGLVVISNPRLNPQKHIDMSIGSYHPHSGFAQYHHSGVRMLEDGSCEKLRRPVSDDEFFEVKRKCASYLQEFSIYFEKYNEVVENFGRGPFGEIDFIEHLKRTI